MVYFDCFYLDKEKDIVVTLYRDGEKMLYKLETPNHRSGNLITNLARICEEELSVNEQGLKVIWGEVPCFITGDNKEVFIMRLGGVKAAKIEGNTISVRAMIPAISKTLMSQTKDYRDSVDHVVVKSFIRKECKFRSDLHTHMNAVLMPDVLMALGIAHQINYPLYYIKKFGLRLSSRQEEVMAKRRSLVEEEYKDSGLEGKALERKIDDNTFINFADLILCNVENISFNIRRIRASLTILKDGQAVFTNLEKTYLYRYVFTKGKSHKELIEFGDVGVIGDSEIVSALRKMLADRESSDYCNNSLFQDKLLWIARSYASRGIRYVEISDTTLVKRGGAEKLLKEVHEVMPKVTKETGVLIRFLCGIRRIPLVGVGGDGEYFRDCIEVIGGIASDPYVAGSDLLGEELNDVRELKPLLKELTRIAGEHEGFTIRVHAGENDSLRSNVWESVRIVEKSLLPGQKMPRVRLGHGLYTVGLHSKRGEKMLEEFRRLGVVLEFQITSNVRLNNLTSLKNHPLKRFLEAGVSCVQGSDGFGFYGVDSMDEQLALDKLLNLSSKDLLKIRKVEDEIITKGLEVFKKQSALFTAALGDGDIEEFYAKRIEESSKRGSALRFGSVERFGAAEVFKGVIEELPVDRIPVVVAGGSFNGGLRKTKVRVENCELIDKFVKRLDPRKYFFVVGDSFEGYEGYLCGVAKAFDVYSFVPGFVSKDVIDGVGANGVKVIVSSEVNRMGLYKSFNYEIFERRSSLVLVFDGNSPADNLIQEAKNGKHRAAIYVCVSNRNLANKVNNLDGYLSGFGAGEDIVEGALSRIESFTV